MKPYCVIVQLPRGFARALNKNSFCLSSLVICNMISALICALVICAAAPPPPIARAQCRDSCSPVASLGRGRNIYGLYSSDSSSSEMDEEPVSLFEDSSEMDEKAAAQDSSEESDTYTVSCRVQ